MHYFQLCLRLYKDNVMTASKCIWLQVQVICELEKVVSLIKYGSARTSNVKAHRTAAALDQITWSLFREQN